MKKLQDRLMAEYAEKLYNHTMRDIRYGDGRDTLRWQEKVKEGFMAYVFEGLDELLKNLQEI